MWHHLLFWLAIAAIAFVYFRYALPGFRKFGPCQDEAKPEAQGGKRA